MCVVIPRAVIALSTENRISTPLLLRRRVSSPPASQDIYCCCHNDLIEAKEPFVGDWIHLQCKLGPSCKDDCTFTREFQGLYFNSVILVNVK